MILILKEKFSSPAFTFFLDFILLLARLWGRYPTGRPN